MDQTQSASNAELGSVKIKLEIEKNASNFLRKQFNKIKQENKEAQELLQKKDNLISTLSSENIQQKGKLKKLEGASRKNVESKVNEEMKEEVERLRESEKMHIHEKTKLKEKIQKLNEKVKAKEEEWKHLVAIKSTKAASNKHKTTELKKLMEEGKKVAKAKDQNAKIKSLESESLKLKDKCDDLQDKCDKLSDELNEAQNELSDKTKVFGAKKAELGRTNGPEVVILPDAEADSLNGSVCAEKATQQDEREYNEARAKQAEKEMHELRNKLEGFGELFLDIRGRVGSLKNKAKHNSVQVEHNIKSVKPRFNNLLDVLKRVSGICEKATDDLENFNDVALSINDNSVQFELIELTNGMNQVASSMKELDYSLMTTQPTFGVLAAEVEHSRADVAELKKKLQEAEKALSEEKSRREEVESMKEDLSELKMLFKKKKRSRGKIARRRSYSRSRSSTSRSRSSSYARRR